MRGSHDKIKLPFDRLRADRLLNNLRVSGLIPCLLDLRNSVNKLSLELASVSLLRVKAAKEDTRARLEIL
jgi:hypothetical protein